MAIKYKSNNVIEGLAADTKPTTNIAVGSIFRTTDTGIFSTFDGSSTWHEEITATQSQTMTNKTMVAQSNSFSEIAQSPLTKRWGGYQPAAGATAATVGTLSGLLAQHSPTGAGTNTNTFDTTEGVLVNLATAATANQNAGLVSPTGGVGIGRRLFGLKARIRSKVDTVAGSVSRFYFGFTSATALPLTDTPLATTDSGIIVGFTSADTNYQIRHNDGSTSVTTTQVTGPVAKDTAFHTIQIDWTASGNITVIFDGVSHTISTDLPLTTANLYFNAVAQSATAAVRTHTIKGVWIEADK